MHSLMWLVGPSIHLCLTHQMVWPHLAFRIWTLLLFFAAWEQMFPLRHLYCCFLLNPWKEAVANNLPSASLPTRGTDLGECSVFVGLDILHCLMFLEEGLASLCVTAFVLGWACWRNRCCLRFGYAQALCH